MTNLRDVALHFNVEKLAALVDPKVVPEAVTGATADEKAKNFAVALQHKLFATEPTAVLQRMVHEAEVPIADATVRSGVTRFLGNLPDFNIRTTSVYTALQHPEAFKDIADEHRALVVEQLKTLQRVQALSPVPEAIPVLMKANLTSAFQVAEMPESTFLEAHGKTLGEETARQVYTNAINARIRNEHALMTMRDAVRGTGLAIIDGKQSPEERMAKLQDVADASRCRSTSRRFLAAWTIASAMTAPPCTVPQPTSSNCFNFCETTTWVRILPIQATPKKTRTSIPVSRTRRSKSCSADGRIWAAWS